MGFALLRIPARISRAVDGRARPGKLCRHTEWRLRRGRRHFRIYLAKSFGALIKRVHLRFHKLSLNFDDIFQILRLAELLHEGRSPRESFGGVA